VVDTFHVVDEVIMIPREVDTIAIVVVEDEAVAIPIEAVEVAGGFEVGEEERHEVQGVVATLIITMKLRRRMRVFVVKSEEEEWMAVDGVAEVAEDAAAAFDNKGSRRIVRDRMILLQMTVALQSEKGKKHTAQTFKESVCEMRSHLGVRGRS